jgi:adenylate cyclase
VISTRLAAAWFGQEDPYRRIVLALWVAAPEAGVRQAVVLLVAWVHGCIGLHFGLRLRPWYPRLALPLFAGALVLLLLALLGFAHAGQDVTARLSREPGWVARTLAEARVVGPDARAALRRVETGVLGGFGAALLLVLGARAARSAYERRVRGIRVEYPDGREVTVPVGFTVLEASRIARVPHASVCGGRGRCSTCRVQIIGGLDALPPPGPEEQRVLARVGAPPNVRLACQLRPRQDVPLLPAAAETRDGFARPGSRRARSARSPCSSPTSAASPRWPSSSCRSTWSSSSSCPCR